MKNTNYKKDLKRHFPLFGMIIISILGLYGLFSLLSSGIFNQDDSLRDALLDNGFEVVYALFFMGVSIYCWYLYFINIMLPPKEDVLYFVKIENEKYFVARDGKKYQSVVNVDIEENKYYKVLKTPNYVLEVLNESYEQFEMKKFENYWLNMYFPGGEKLEDILMLPIVYVMALPGLIFSLLGKTQLHRSLGLLLFIIPLSVIVNDIYIKRKIKKDDCDELSDDILKKSDTLFETVIFTVALYFMYSLMDYIPLPNIRVLIIPIFVLVFICALDKPLRLLNKEKLNYFYDKFSAISYILTFMIEFTLMAIFFINKEDNINVYYILIPIYVIGTILILSELFKKNKKKDV